METDNRVAAGVAALIFMLVAGIILLARFSDQAEKPQARNAYEYDGFTITSEEIDYVERHGVSRGKAHDLLYKEKSDEIFWRKWEQEQLDKKNKERNQ